MQVTTLRKYRGPRTIVAYIRQEYRGKYSSLHSDLQVISMHFSECLGAIQDGPDLEMMVKVLRSSARQAFIEIGMSEAEAIEASRSFSPTEPTQIVPRRATSELSEALLGGEV